MIDVFRIALTQPSKISTLVKNKVYKIIIFVVTIILLSVTPTIIRMATNHGYDASIYTEIASSFYNQDFGNTEMQVQDNILLAPESFIYVVQGFNVTTDNTKSRLSISDIELKMSSTGIILKTMFMESRVYTYEELEMNNIKFSKLSKADSLKIANALVYAIDRNSTMIVWYNIIKDLLFKTLVYLLGAVILMTAFRSKLVFASREVRYQIALYSLGLPFLIHTIFNLFSIMPATLMMTVLFWIILFTITTRFHNKAYQKIYIDAMLENQKNHKKGD